MKYNDEQISDLIKDVLQQKNISQKELSIKTKIDINYINAILNKQFKILPKGPYKSLFFKDILKFLDINLDDYFNKDKYIKNIDNKSELSNDDFDSAKKQKKEIIGEQIKEVKQDDINKIDNVSITNKKKSSSKNLVNVLIVIILISLAVIFYVKVYNIDGKNINSINQQDSTLIDTDTTNLQVIKKDSVVADSLQKDSLYNINVKDSVGNKKIVKLDTIPRAKITRYRKWNQPKGVAISNKRLKKRYSKGNKIVVKAFGSGVKVKYITKDDFWWRSIKKGDKIEFAINKAIYFDIYHPDSVEIFYLNKKWDLVNALYARYIIGLNIGLKLKDVYLN